MLERPDFLEAELRAHNATAAADAGTRLAAMVPESSYVGELLKLDYASAEVLVHDSHRQAVGGLPLGCFLLASRLPPDGPYDPDQEDSALILLRVTGVTKLPNAMEMDYSRFQAGQRSSDTPDTWDAQGKTDQFTLHQLRFSGVRCRVLGTYYMKNSGRDAWDLAFGSDISNFYSGRGLKVFRPTGSALSTIVNFSRPILSDAHPLAGQRVRIGRIRYASAERRKEEGTDVAVNLDPTDLIARRTALFGMSRTGKSNTTKMIASAVFCLRGANPQRGRIGQLIFDVNGEYANDNPIDRGCLRNVYRTIPGGVHGDVVTYGQAPHPNDPGRRVIKINFYGADPPNQRAWDDPETVSNSLEPLLVGKQAIDAVLAKEQSKYIRSFRDTSLEPPADTSPSEITRYRRSLLVYRTILKAAGFSPPQEFRNPNIRGLFGQDLRNALANTTARGNKANQYRAAATILESSNPSLDQLREAFTALRTFIEDGTGGYEAFNNRYAQDHDGRSWHDDRLTGLLSLFEYPAGVRTFRSLHSLHDSNAVADYAEAIATDLVEGRLVIVDQSMGDPEINRSAAERIMWAVFNRQKAQFVQPQVVDNVIQPLPDVIVYAEEAHNLLPATESGDLRRIWSRVAKEGSKYRIGLVYATQEPSSLQSNILKNTDNWFVAHLNNSDEVKELRKYYDFEDFADSIIQAPDPGFIRMRTLSNPYIVPIQVDPFILPEAVDAVS